MTAYMYDGAYAPDVKAVKAHGGIAINGYITANYAHTSGQPNTAHAAGLGWVATYEESASELVHASYATGQAVGRKILAALEARGVPKGKGIAVYPSVDVEVAGGIITACDAGFKGIQSILHGIYSVRCYGEGALIDHLVKSHLVDGKNWLSASSSFPGYNPNDRNVCLVQHIGSPIHGTDQNNITDIMAVGAWWPVGSPYIPKPPTPTPTPTPTIKKERDTMFYQVDKADCAARKVPWPGVFTKGDGKPEHVLDNESAKAIAINTGIPYSASMPEVSYAQHESWAGTTTSLLAPHPKANMEEMRLHMDVKE